jgi:hypothetical protein
MSNGTVRLFYTALFAFAVIASGLSTSSAGDDGIVRVKSAYSIADSISRASAVIGSITSSIRSK